MGDLKAKLLRLGYRVAWKAMVLTWRVVPGEGRGAAVALHTPAGLLLVMPSYRDRFDLPGGGCGRREAPRDCALRELFEEAGVRLSSDALGPEIVIRWRDGLRDHSYYVFPCRLEQPPRPAVDGVEIIWAGYRFEDTISAQEVSPPVRRYLQRLGHRPEAQSPMGTPQISRA